MDQDESAAEVKEEQVIYTNNTMAEKEKRRKITFKILLIIICICIVLSLGSLYLFFAFKNVLAIFSLPLWGVIILMSLCLEAEINDRKDKEDSLENGT